MKRNYLSFIALAILAITADVHAQNVRGTWKCVVSSPGGSTYYHSDVAIGASRNGVSAATIILRKSNNPGAKADVGVRRSFTLTRKRANVFTYQESGFNRDPNYGGNFVSRGDLKLVGNQLLGSISYKSDKLPGGVNSPMTLTRSTITALDCTPPRRRSGSRSTGRSRPGRQRASSSRLRTYSKARLRVRNNTNQKINVSVRYRTNSNQSRTWRWASRSYTINPGQSLLTRPASRVQLKATGNRGGRWSFDNWLVKRTYRSSRIGVSTLNFR